MKTGMACVTDFLFEDCDRGSIALQSDTEATTYGELESAINQLAIYLLGLDYATGDRILLVGENSPFWVIAYLATLRAGFVSVPLPGTISSRELTRVIELTEAKAALVDERAARRHSETLAPLHVVTNRLGDVASAGATSAFPSIAPDDLAALMMTSGSTGVPQGVMVTHGNIIANTRSIIESLQLVKSDRVMTVLPFHYCFGTSLLHSHLRVGGSLVLDSRFMYPEVVLDRIEHTQCTGFAGVPSHFQILLRSSSLRKRRFDHLRYIQQAGGHLPPALVDELRAALPRTRIFTMYGQTEATARLSCLPPESLDAKRGSIGKGLPGVRLRVLNESGVQVLPGEVGEIVAEGENITKGYWRAPRETRETFRDGCLYTGDLATVDDEGFIYIDGRKKDFIKCRGERISCQQIEMKLLHHEGILEAAVIPMPDDLLGEAIKAFVVPRTPGNMNLAGELRAYYEARLPAHLVPKEIVVVPALPKNASGKISKRALTSTL
jgi:acyl-CoA synthetase (AMP-forming)/AMP-acid ligase II